MSSWSKIKENFFTSRSCPTLEDHSLALRSQIMFFNEFGFDAGLLRSIGDRGYTIPTPIQSKSIPAILSGRDVIAAAQTGTGKTAGFTLPILHKLSQEPPEKGIRPLRALVLTPTRELAAQVGESVKSYSEHLPLRSTVVFGGVNINPQKAHLRGGVDILVATPGRLLDLIEQEIVSLSQIKYFVLDEADRMLDMGFLPAIKKIMDEIPQQKQTLLFSATFSNEIIDLTDSILNDPIMIKVANDNATADTVHQEVYFLEKNHKTTFLRHLIETENWEQVLVFTRTKRGADRLCKKLEKKKIESISIHGDKSQAQRLKALKKFKEKKIRVLVATDLAARGLDILELPHVVNYEIPNVPEDYVHRIGRTGRAGLKGHAVSLVGPEEKIFLQRIEKLTKQKMTRLNMPDLPDLPEAPRKTSKTKPLKTNHKSKESRHNVKPALKKKKTSTAKAKERKKLKVNPIKK